MGKGRTFPLGALLLFGLCSSCGPSQIHKEYRGEFTFENTGMAEAKADYPLSTGRTFYVSSTLGKEGNDGLSEAAPLSSIDEVNKLSLTAGDSVLFKKGDVFVGKISLRDLTGEDDNPITFASYGEGEKPILTNGDSIYSATVVYIQQSSNVVIRDLEISVTAGDRKLGAPCNTGINISYRDSGTKKYKNIYICNNNIHAALPTGATYEVIDANVMGVILSSNEATYAASKPQTVSNVYITGNEVHSLGRTGIYTTANNYTQSGENHHDVHYDKFLNVHIDNNYVHHVGSIGMYIKSGSYCSMNRNLIHDTGVSTDSTILEGETGMMYICATHSEAKFNHVYRVFDQNTGYDAMGIDIDWNTYDIDIAYNYCHDCQGSGIGTMATNTSFIRNNRIENNLGETTHNGSIVVSNFIPPVMITGLTEEWLGVDNLKIEDNLVLHNQYSKYLFRHKLDNGNTNFTGNSFNRNHCVYTGDYPDEFQWFAIDVPWNAFNENRFYSSDISKFRSMDLTPAEKVENEAEPFVLTRARPFSEWQKRDPGSTYELLSDLVPSEIYNPTATFEEGKLALSWESEKDDAWHYNVYEVASEDGVPEYQDMLGEAFTKSFLVDSPTIGNHLYAIEPESPQGVKGNIITLAVGVR